MADGNRCRHCGAEYPADAPGGPCPHCETDLAEPPGPSDVAIEVEAVTAADSTATSAEPTGLPDAPTTRPVSCAGGAPIEPTGDWTPDPEGPTRTVADGAARDLQRGVVIRYFGDYEIRRELGRGGMGVVYEAKQVSLNRPVALKMVKAGILADEAELRRFQNEAEAVALLDHPGVVPVFEVGEHDGQRYFSMKLVQGGNLARRLSDYRGDPRAAAALMAEVAEAVHHAHMRGILHRDLKPANILIDAEGHPHVTDFGLAKRVEADAEMTQSGAILGTPAYMSPEQAHGRRGTITTATDVYGLGAILYALLTGKAPFGGDSVMETLDAVRTLAPEPPTRANSGVPRDLETICLKCLEKDPRRRYTSAQALADDLNAWLESRPIAARRVGPGERAWLWCKRKPAVAAWTAAALLAMVGGTITVIAVQARANADLKAANLREKQRFDLAMAAIKLFHGEVSEDLLLKEKQFEGLRRKLLNGAADFYGKLEDLLKGQDDPASREALGRAYFELGELTADISDQTRGLAVHRKAIEVRRAVAAQPKAGFEARRDLALSLLASARWQALTGDTDGALKSALEARQLAEGLDPPGHQGEAATFLIGTALYTIGFVKEKTGSPDEAIEAFRQSLAIRRRLAARPGNRRYQSDLASCYSELGTLTLAVGKPDEAQEHYERARAVTQALVDANPKSLALRRLLASSDNDLGYLMANTGRPDEALTYHERARAVREQLVEANPTVVMLRRDLAQSHANIGQVMLTMHRPVEALASFGRAVEIMQPLAEANPTLTEIQRYLALCLDKSAVALLQMNRVTEAAHASGRAIDILSKLAGDLPRDAQVRRDLATIHGDAGLMLHRIGKIPEAVEQFRRALAIYGKMAESNPSNVGVRRDRAQADEIVGLLLLEGGRPAEALPHFDRARAQFEALAEADRREPRYRAALANSWTNVAAVRLAMGRASEARDAADRAVAMREAMIEAGQRSFDVRAGLGEALLRAGQARLAQGDAVGAVACWRRAEATFRALPARPGEAAFYEGCCHAMLAGVGGLDGSAISAAEGGAEADEAVRILRVAARTGYGSPDAYLHETALIPLRNHPGFRQLAADLIFHAVPFAR